MPSIRYIYRSGRGPSSSHTIGPFNAAKHFLNINPNAASFRVTLYGSLAATHAGHMTDKAIKDAFSSRKVEFKFKEGSFLAKHPNGMMFEALDQKRKTTSTWMAYSVGGTLLWISSFVLAGYFFGTIPFVKNNFTVVILAVIFISLLPGIIAYAREKLSKRGMRAEG